MKKKINFDFVDTRVTFLQKLEKNIATGNFNILTIGVENYKKLRNTIDKYKAKKFLEDLLIFIDNILTTKSSFAQYESYMYIAVFKNISFEELQKIADDFQTRIVEFVKQQDFNPFIEIFTFDVKNLDFNTILTTLDKISTNTLTQNDIKNQQVKHIRNKYAIYDSEEEIYFLLKSIFVKDIELKLLNFYKGLNVNTNAKIVKIENDSIQVKFEYIQGVVMQNENTTILNSSSFIKDIQADVQYVSLKKRIAILENFRFLDEDTSMKKLNKVMCATKIPIVISQKYRGSISGEILNISIDAVAIKARYTKMVDNIRSGDVKLSFVLPSDKNYDGFMKLELNATVELVICNDTESEICKIVCNIEHDNKSKPILTHYVHSRQKEIILELKKLMKLNS